MKTNLLSIVSILFLSSVHLAEAQQQTRIPRIGFLSGSSAVAVSPRVEAFRQGLRELGYVEGENIVVEWRYAEGKLGRVRELAIELVRLKVDVIVSAGAEITRVAKEATAPMPIVMTMDPDPIGNGFVASLARPGGNITGLSTLHPEIGGKRLELLKEIVPSLSRVAVFGDSSFPGNAQVRRETELATGAFKVDLQYLDVRTHKDIEALFRAASNGRPQAVLVVGGLMLYSQRARVVELAAKSRLPTIYGAREYVEDGGLMSYGARLSDLDRRAATYVDKILKGAKPADLPVEQPTKFELMINLKTAKQIGLTVPPNVLARADKVIR